MTPPPRFLYLHGFASGPGSKKGRAFSDHFAPRAAIQRLNLRVPSFEHLRLSTMIDTVIEAIGDARDRAVVIGSSLGGLTAARAAERDPRIAALVLMAPAFQIAARWRQQLGDDLEVWRQRGWHEVIDHTTGAPARVDFGFFDDLVAVDAEPPDVRVPTLILHGRNDDVVPIEHSRRFAAGKRHVRLIELDDDHELVTSIPILLEHAERFLAPWLDG